MSSMWLQGNAVKHGKLRNLVGRKHARRHGHGAVAAIDSHASAATDAICLSQAFQRFTFQRCGA